MKHNHSCAQCLFSDVCNSNELCEHYAPCHDLDSELADDVIQFQNENERVEFEYEYRDYLDRFYNEK